jgi:hypothetical protein
MEAKCGSSKPTSISLHSILKVDQACEISIDSSVVVVLLDFFYTSESETLVRSGRVTIDVIASWGSFVYSCEEYELSGVGTVNSDWWTGTWGVAVGDKQTRTQPFPFKRARLVVVYRGGSFWGFAFGLKWGERTTTSPFVWSLDVFRFGVGCSFRNIVLKVRKIISVASLQEGYEGEFSII